MRRKTPLADIVAALACTLVLKTAVAVWMTYPDYFPPDFRSDFLTGRQGYFFGPYQWAFYAHIVSGPFVLVTGLVLLFDSLRRRFPAWHRRLGRVHAACVLFVVAPSGLWMAGYAPGLAASLAFAVLAVATAICAALGWRAAVQRNFDRHRDWMARCYALLCSAVVLRAIGGLSEVLGMEGTYAWAAWASWILPLAALELTRFTRRSFRRRQSSSALGVRLG